MRERIEALRRARPQANEPAAGGTTAPFELPLPGLPSLRPRRALGRLTARVGDLGAPTLEARRALSAYWRVTEQRLRRWQVWRLNPVALVWNAARDLKNLAVFAAKMSQERL
jgi:hypothetical protein